jgi:hypothetical protein
VGRPRSDDRALEPPGNTRIARRQGAGPPACDMRRRACDLLCRFRAMRALLADSGHGYWVGRWTTPGLAVMVAAGLALVGQAHVANGQSANPSAPTRPEGADGVQPGDTAPACVPVWVIDAAGITRLSERCPRTPIATTQSQAVAPAQDDDCDPPWFVDANGIRRLHMQCLDAAPEPPAIIAPARPGPGATASASDSCDPPWVLDANGIRRLHMQCLGLPPQQPALTAPAVSSTSDACDPPWFLDANGIRRLHMQCLGLAPTAMSSQTRDAPSSATGCEPPWWVDASGIRRLRPACL